jgi:2'-5' RNA ligase
MDNYDIFISTINIKMSEAYGKDVKTAIIIMPPKEVWEQIQSIRKEHDSAYVRWMPHINLMFPFVTIDNFTIVKELLENKIQALDIKPFEIEFKNLSYFYKKKTSTLFADPSTSNDDPLQKIYSVIANTLPHLPTRNEFTPHLTLGNSWNSLDAIKSAKDDIQQSWKPIKFTVDAIYMISRKDKDDPFQIVDTIELCK